MVRAIPGAPIQYDVNAMFNYKDLFWLGGMYRSQYSATVSTAVALAKQFILGYSYDIAVHSNRQYTRGANEVMIGYRFGGSPAEDPAIKKRFDQVEERIKKNEGDIKDVKDKDEKQDEELDQIKKEVDDVKEDVKKLRGDFDDFKSAIDQNKLESGSKFSFKNVYFETDKSNIRGVDVSELKSLSEILKNNATIRISITGHADKRGTREYNLRLSRRRAEAVRDYLVSQGISRDRLEIGYESFDNPASNNFDDNRRVEFTVLSK
jgi:outer membrane protein OmpA-like peptidoglycan-associated protein